MTSDSTGPPGPASSAPSGGHSGETEVKRRAGGDGTTSRGGTIKKANPSQVVCTGDGLRFGYINRPISASIETKHAGPGELTVFCEGPEKNAYCELEDHENGAFTLTITAQDIGRHTLHICYNTVEVPGSPFNLRVSPASLVRLRGPGLHHGLLEKYCGEFLMETREAGPGEVKIRVGGPKGAFKVKTQREGRNLLCKYNPKDSGLYILNIYWSGDHVPGSPFKVYRAHNQDELDQFLATQASQA